MSATCSTCGVALNEGEAKCFTVCDDCWDKHYKTGKYAPTKPAARCYICDEECSHAQAMADARRAALEEAAIALDAKAATLENALERLDFEHCAKYVRALLDDAGRKACYCDAPEFQAKCPVHG